MPSHPPRGGLVCDSCAPRHAAQPLSIEVLKTLRYLLAEGFHGAGRMTADPAVRAEVRQILRGYATATVEREIKSARMLEGRGRGSAAPALTGARRVGVADVAPRTLRSDFIAFSTRSFGART